MKTRHKRKALYIVRFVFSLVVEMINEDMDLESKEYEALENLFDAMKKLQETVGKEKE